MTNEKLYGELEAVSPEAMQAIADQAGADIVPPVVQAPALTEYPMKKCSKKSGDNRHE